MPSRGSAPAPKIWPAPPVSCVAVAERVPAKDVYWLVAVSAARLAAVELPVVYRGAKPEVESEGPRLWRELVPVWQDVLPDAGLPGGGGLEA